MKKALLSLFFAHLIFTAGAQIQAPGIQWQVSYGGSFSDGTKAIQQSRDGGYVIAGNTNSSDGDVTGNHNGSVDYWIVKLNSLGALQWQKCLGGSGTDGANDIEQTTDNGYIVAGTADSNDGDVTGNHGTNDYWVVKIDSTGSIVWQKSLGGSGDDQMNSIQQTKDGGYIGAGFSNSTDGNVTGNHGGYDFWIVKLSDTGAIKWQKSIGGSGTDLAYAVQQTKDGGYIVAGSSNSTDGDAAGNSGFLRYWIVKLDSTGNIVWQKSHGGSGGDTPYTIQQTTDGGYIVGGATGSTDGDVTGYKGDGDYWVVKLNDTGAIQFERCLGGTGNEQQSSLQQTSDGGYIITCSTSSTDDNVTGNHGDYDYWVVKLSSIDSIQWQKCLGGTFNDFGNAVRQTTDGGYIVAGFSDSKEDGDVTVTNKGEYDFWILKLGSDATGINNVNKLNRDDLFSIQPNPNNGSFEIGFDGLMNNGRVEILNAIGQEVYSSSVLTGKNIPVSLPKLTNGVYFIRLYTSQGVEVKKFVVGQ